jgi:hypothetical protein
MIYMGLERAMLLAQINSLYMPRATNALNAGSQCCMTLESQ